MWEYIFIKKFVNNCYEFVENWSNFWSNVNIQLHRCSTCFDDFRLPRLSSSWHIDDLPKFMRKMQRTLTLEREISVSQETQSFCLVCENGLDSSSSTNIFYASLPRFGELLASFVLRVLRPVASDLRSSYICARCHDLFQMLEQAQWTASNVRNEILKVYRSRETNEAPDRKIDLSAGQILPEDDIFVDDSAEEEKNIVQDGRFVDIQELRSLNVARNEFDGLNIEINNLENSSGINEKSEIEDSLAISERNEYKVEKSTLIKNERIKSCGKNTQEITSQSFVEISNEFLTKSTQENRDNCVENVNEISNEFLTKSAHENGDNCVENIDEISNELLTKSAREEREKAREIISQISNELQKNIAQEEDHRIEDRENAREIIEDISSSIIQNLDSANEKKSLYTQQCGLCNRLFKSAKDLQSHSIKHGGSRPYRCRKCNERFAEFSEGNNHSLEMHSSVKNCISVSSEPADNEIVDFSKEDWIFPNEFRRNELEDFTGSTDGTETKNNKKIERPSWKSGRISKYSLKPLKYPCSTCGKKWRTSAELKTHVKSHSNLRPYMCEKCGQAYKHKHALEIHVGMHNGISPFQCSVCNKCFTQKGALMRHLPMHTGETPYQCELCGKRFVHHTSYNMHALSHTGKKSYQCHVCDLSLLSTSHLKRHMRVHTGEKPYSCTLCGKSFAERYNLFAHQKIHDPVEIMAKAAKKMTYKCEQCDEFFVKKQKLEDHTKEHHHSSSSNDPTNGRKWIGHTVEVETPARSDDSLIEQSWQDLDYAKLQSVGLKAAQNDNQLSQLSHESIAMLMSQTNYNKGMSVVIQPTNSTINTEIDRTQI